MPTREEIEINAKKLEAAGAPATEIEEYVRLAAEEFSKTSAELAEPTFPQKVVNSPALPIAGGVIGGMMGGIPGAALGGAGGEAIRQLGKRALDLPVPSTSMDAAKEIGMSGLEQGAGEFVGGKLVAPVVSKVGSVLKKPAGDLFQIITKIKPQDAATLFKNPKAILPGQWEKAKKAWRVAAENAGIPVDDVSPEIINALKKDARSTVFETFEKIKGGGNVSAAESQIAKQALDIALMPAAKTERNKPLVALYGKMRSVFTERIGKESPELAEANKQYGIAKAGKKFHSLFPRNLDDSPAYFRSTILPAIVGSASSERGNDPVGGFIGAGATMAASSPLAFGAGIAAAGGPGKLALPIIRRAVSGSVANSFGRKRKKENED